MELARVEIVPLNLHAKQNVRPVGPYWYQLRQFIRYVLTAIAYKQLCCH